MSTELSIVNPWGQGLDVSHLKLDEMFPKIDHGLKPFGHRVLVQVRRVVTVTAGGIYLPKETRETEAYNGTIAKLIDVGPLAFKTRSTRESWPEGIWAEVGEYVHISRYGGDRWTVDMNDGLEPVVLALMGDADLLGKYTGDITKVRAHIV